MNSEMIWSLRFWRMSGKYLLALEKAQVPHFMVWHGFTLSYFTTHLELVLR